MIANLFFALLSLSPALAADPSPSEMREDIRATIRSHLSEVRDCYEVALKQHPSTAGSVVVNFAIAANGKVERAEIDELKTTVKPPDFLKCISETVRKWTFPAIKNTAQERDVSYPFVFSKDAPAMKKR